MNNTDLLQSNFADQTAAVLECCGGGGGSRGPF